MLQEPFYPRDTSAQAYAAMGNVRKKQMQDDILAIVSAAQRRGQYDMSAQEVRRILELQYQAERGAHARVDMSSMTSPIARLIDAGLLLRLKDMRLCTVTQRNIHPLRIVAQQSRLVR